jgi:hypothetical protein
MAARRAVAGGLDAAPEMTPQPKQPTLNSKKSPARIGPVAPKAVFPAADLSIPDGVSEKLGTGFTGKHLSGRRNGPGHVFRCRSPRTLPAIDHELQGQVIEDIRLDQG